MAGHQPLDHSRTPLTEQVQDGNAFSKWDALVCTEIFLSWSKYHAISIALVLNPRTDHISPQYHVIFDDKFESIHKPKQTENFDLLRVLSKQENRYHPIENSIQVDFDTFGQPPKQLDQSTNLQGPTQIDEPGPYEQRGPSLAPRDAETASQMTEESNAQSNCSKQRSNEEEPSLDTSDLEGVIQILKHPQSLSKKLVQTIFDRPIYLIQCIYLILQVNEGANVKDNDHKSFNHTFKMYTLMHHKYTMKKQN